MVALSEKIQPVTVSVAKSVYVVRVVGLANGLEIELLEREEEGAQEYTNELNPCPAQYLK